MRGSGRPGRGRRSVPARAEGKGVAARGLCGRSGGWGQTGLWPGPTALHLAFGPWDHYSPGKRRDPKGTSLTLLFAAATIFSALLRQFVLPGALR